MVKKLIKYDFISFFRLLFPAQMILIGLAAVNRVIQCFESLDQPLRAYETSPYQIVCRSSIVLFVIGCGALLLMTLVVAVVRFYQGLYSKEGYLSHTLPVTAGQHIFSKLLTSLLFLFGSILTVFVSICIATLGEVNAELFKAAFYVLGDLFGHFKGHMILYIIEVLLLMLFYLSRMVLKLFFCISIGQLAPKLKLLLAFGVYFGLYILEQIVGTFFIVLFAVVGFEELYEQINNLILHHPTAATHVILLSMLLIEVILSTVYYFISLTLMKKKLNLS